MPLDADDKKFITELLATHTAEAIKKSQEEADKRLDARLAKEREETKKLLPPKDDDKRDDNGRFTSKEELSALKKQLDAEKAAREKAEGDRKAEQLRSAAGAALASAGVERTSHALALLDASEGRLAFTDDGRPGLKFRRNGYEEVVPLDKGVSEWLRTDDGKAFLPASGAQGTGTGTAARHGAGQAAPAKIGDLRDSLGTVLSGLGSAG